LTLAVVVSGCRSKAGAGQGGDAGGTSSPGCRGGPSRVPHRATLTVDGVARHLYVVPPTSNGTAPVPAVIGFHGSGGTGRPVADFWGFERASGGKALGLYPDGVAQSWYQNTVGWDTRSADSSDVKFVDAIMAWAESSYCVDSSRWYAVGFSWGGWMANHVGCARPNRFRSVVSVSGGGPSIACAGPVAVMVVHGTADTAEPIAEAEASVNKWIATNGCQASTVPAFAGSCVEYSGCSAGHPLVWCRHSGGHELPAFLKGGALWNWLSRP
jgi:poly(3-hydroxybutyrate) depolymerase